MQPDATAEIEVVGALDLTRTVRRLHLFGRADPTLALAEDGLWRGTSTPDGPAEARLVPIPGGVQAQAWGPGASWAVEAARAWIGADDPGWDPVPPALGPLVERALGVRLGHGGRVFDVLAQAILAQLVAGVEAGIAWARLVRVAGGPGPGPGRVAVPPDPGAIRSLSTASLHALGVVGRRGPTLIEAARRAGRLDALAEAPAERAEEGLRAVRGVGPWTAAMSVSRSHHAPDLVPVGDYNLPSAVAWALAGEPCADDARMLDLLAPYTGQRGRIVAWVGAAGIVAPRRGPRHPLSQREPW